MTPIKPSKYDLGVLTGLVLLLALASATDSLWITPYASLILGPRAGWVFGGMLKAQGHEEVKSGRLRVFVLPFKFGFWGVMCTHGYVLISSILLITEAAVGVN